MPDVGRSQQTPERLTQNGAPSERDVNKSGKVRRRPCRLPFQVRCPRCPRFLLSGEQAQAPSSPQIATLAPSPRLEMPVLLAKTLQAHRAWKPVGRSPHLPSGLLGRQPSLNGESGPKALVTRPSSQSIKNRNIDQYSRRQPASGPGVSRNLLLFASGWRIRLRVAVVTHTHHASPIARPQRSGMNPSVNSGRGPQRGQFARHDGFWSNRRRQAVLC